MFIVRYGLLGLLGWLVGFGGVVISYEVIDLYSYARAAAISKEK